MNSPDQGSFASQAASGAAEAEQTLRIVAGVAAPEGLEDRVKMALRQAPRSARVVHWPGALEPRRKWLHGNLLRVAAAAAIVFVVAGGGWRIYSRVEPAPTAKVIAMPRVAAPGGFSSAGAMRTPQTLNGPVLARPLKGAGANQAQGNALKPAPRAAKKQAKRGAPDGSKTVKP